MRGIYLIIGFYITSVSLSAQSSNIRVKKAELDFYGIETLGSASFNVSITYHFSQPLESELTLKVLNFNTPVANSVYFTKDAQGGVQRITFKGNAKVMTGKISRLFTSGLGDKLTVFYRIPVPDMNDAFDLTLPIVYPDMPSESNIATLFSASLELPENANIYEQFPTQTWSIKSTPPTKVHQLSLPAIPSVITLNRGTGPQPFFSTLRIVGGFIILVLLILLVLGWKKIKQL